MNRVGYRWWTAVPSIGPHKAARLRQWLAGYANVDGLARTRAAVTPRAQLGPAVELLRARVVRSEIAPLERFLVPQALDGCQGRLRADRARKQIAADNDYEAIAAWLTARATNALKAPGACTTPCCMASHRRCPGCFVVTWWSP
jgi:hypothetical protein